MGVNRLAWKNKLLMKNELAVKEITNMLLMFDWTCLAFLCAEEHIFH
jgi:hypothetical protein